LRLHEAGSGEAAIGKFKQVISGGLRTDRRRALNRMLELGRPISVRVT